ncbi:phosphotransferase enzyme family protein [Robiginitalea sp.]|uniref:phosphotransferase enzyme family protein n=1 Tax=Robiginitalea sp. TaxID=1902411 RepID=UPI003C7519FE
MDPTQPLEILSQFGISGAGISLESLTQGYINDTFRVHTPKGDGFVLQRINRAVFPKPELLMANLEEVLPLLEAPGYRGLKLQQNTEGGTSVKDAGGSLWRVFHYIPDSASYTRAETLQMAREAGRIVATFHILVTPLPPDTLQVPLPGFHDIHLRFTQLKAAISTAAAQRKEKCTALIAQAQALYAFCRHIPFSDLPLRVCHNDTKLSNILFDTRSSKALCLIDLDTLMPGHLLYDFGDGARGLISDSPENGKTQKTAGADLERFGAFVKGWKDSGLNMEPLERQWLCHGVVLMPALHGIRALADYLCGDRYYKVAYPEQNRDRAGQLLQTAQTAQKALGPMQEIVKNMWA